MKNIFIFLIFWEISLLSIYMNKNLLNQEQLRKQVREQVALYRAKRKSEGWKSVFFTLPSEIKDKVMAYKNTLMDEYETKNKTNE